MSKSVLIDKKDIDLFDFLEEYQIGRRTQLGREISLYSFSSPSVWIA
jgi:hypothetical protein